MIAGNELLGWLFDARGANHLMTLSASTVAVNSIIGGGVVRGIGSCNIDNAHIGSRVYRSSIWQLGKRLMTAAGAIQLDCFRFVMGNNFTGIPASVEREVNNPQFVGEAIADYHLSLCSAAIDFAPPQPVDSTRDRGARIADLPQGDLLGPQDLVAYEEPRVDRIFRSGFESSKEQ